MTRTRIWGLPKNERGRGRGQADYSATATFGAKFRNKHALRA
jgi:hypothetical protein